MFLRLLFVLLIALNIAVGAWLVLGQDDVHVRSVTDPGVPVLHLLTERPDLVAAASAPGFGRFAPYLERLRRRPSTPRASSVPRTI